MKFYPITKTRIEQFREFTAKGCTIGEAYNFAHKLWDEKNANDMEELGNVEDPNLLFLYFH